MEPKPINEQSKRPAWVRWLKRMGVAGFLFFLIKGLVWIAVFYGLTKYIGCEA